VNNGRKSGANRTIFAFFRRSVSFSFLIRSRSFWRSEIVSTRSCRETFLGRRRALRMRFECYKIRIDWSRGTRDTTVQRLPLADPFERPFWRSLLLVYCDLSGNKWVPGRSRPTKGSSASSGIEWCVGLLFPTLFEPSLTLQELQSNLAFARSRVLVLLICATSALFWDVPMTRI
jgi:hypothetical protein